MKKVLIAKYKRHDEFFKYTLFDLYYKGEILLGHSTHELRDIEGHCLADCAKNHGFTHIKVGGNVYTLSAIKNKCVNQMAWD